MVSMVEEILSMYTFFLLSLLRFLHELMRQTCPELTN